MNLTIITVPVKKVLSADVRQKMEERMANTPRMGGWVVPKVAERFGVARRDLDYIDPNNKTK